MWNVQIIDKEWSLCFKDYLMLVLIHFNINIVYANMDYIMFLYNLDYLHHKF